MCFKQPYSRNPRISGLQQERDQLAADLAELQEDLKIVQGLIHHKQQKLRALNQELVNKTRHVRPVLTCLTGGLALP